MGLGKILHSRLNHLRLRWKLVAATKKQIDTDAVRDALIILDHNIEMIVTSYSKCYAYSYTVQGEPSSIKFYD